MECLGNLGLDVADVIAILFSIAAIMFSIRADMRSNRAELRAQRLEYRLPPWSLTAEDDERESYRLRNEGPKAYGVKVTSDDEIVEPHVFPEGVTTLDPGAEIGLTFNHRVGRVARAITVTWHHRPDCSDAPIPWRTSLL